MNNVSHPHQHQTIVCLMMWVLCFLFTLQPVPHLCYSAHHWLYLNSGLPHSQRHIISSSYRCTYSLTTGLSLEKLFHVLPLTVCLSCSRSPLLSTSSIHSAICLNKVTPLSSRKPLSHSSLSTTRPQPHRLLPSGETSSWPSYSKKIIYFHTCCGVSFWVQIQVET